MQGAIVRAACNQCSGT